MEQGRVLNRRGELVHVVHQYDRRKRLLASLGRRYALVERPEVPPQTAAPVDTATAFTSQGWPQQQTQPPASGAAVDLLAAARDPAPRSAPTNAHALHRHHPVAVRQRGRGPPSAGGHTHSRVEKQKKRLN